MDFKKETDKLKQTNKQHDTDNKTSLKSDKLSEEKIWDILLESHSFRKRTEANEKDGRNPFDSDYGRLISSAAIRRLQDKTQVFPLEKNDFIRTRLTHSLEVSYIASSLGLSIEKRLLENKLLAQDKKGFLSSLLRVSGLIHDLGNPPFGHFGEKAIQSFFSDYFNKHDKTIKDLQSYLTENKINKEHFFNSNKNEYSEKLLRKYPNIEFLKEYYKITDAEKNDYLKFDGNVQTFRILTKLQFFKDEFSFNLTFPTLAAIIKYPFNSIEGNKTKDNILKKKFGYFQSEETEYNRLAKELNIKNKRHPITYLLEAADDIAFSAADIEDGVKLHLVDYNDIYSIFSEHLKEDTNKNDILKCLKDYYFNASLPDSEKLFTAIQNFRVYTQSIMINAVIDSFFENYEQIMKGELQKELIDLSTAKNLRKCFKETQYKIFDASRITLPEIAGWEVIYGLLNIFMRAAESPNFDVKGGNTKESRLYKLISSSYRFVYENYSDKNKVSPQYRKIQLIVDFIAGMTDSYALHLYQKLKGITI